MKNNLLPIAKEGFSYILISILALIIFSILDLDFLGFLSFISVIILLITYRNPEREISSLQNTSVISPVDGNIIAIEDLSDGDFAYRVDIQSNYFDVSLLRAPMSATIKDMKIIKGARVSKNSSKFSDLNEKAELLIGDDKNTIKLVHTLKQSFAPLKLTAKKGDDMLQGNRYGIVLNGITSIYLPLNFRLNVKLTDDVKASESLIGYFS